MLERTLDEIARNDQNMSGGEKVFRGLEPEQLYAVCANSLHGGAGSHHDVGVETFVKSLVLHAHLPILLSCLCHYSDCWVGRNLSMQAACTRFMGILFLS